jgi:hypothetical protein
MRARNPGLDDVTELFGLLHQFGGLGIARNGGVEIIDLVPFAAADIEVLDQVHGRVSEEVTGGLERDCVVAGVRGEPVARTGNDHTGHLKGGVVGRRETPVGRQRLDVCVREITRDDSSQCLDFRKARGLRLYSPLSQ